MEKIIEKIVNRMPAKFKTDAKEIIYCMFLADYTIQETAKRINKPEKYVFECYQLVKNIGNTTTRKAFLA